MGKILSSLSNTGFTRYSGGYVKEKFGVREYQNQFLNKLGYNHVFPCYLLFSPVFWSTNSENRKEQNRK